MAKYENKSTVTKSFKFRPNDWSELQAEAQRLNMPVAQFVKLACIHAMGKFQPLPRFDYSYFVSEGEFKGEGRPVEMA